MRTYASGLIALVAMVAVSWFPAAPGRSHAAGKEKKNVVFDKVLTEVIAEAVKNVQTGLDSRANDKKTPALVRTNALLIALAAQDGMGKEGINARQLATIREAALALAKAAPGKKLDLTVARKQADILAQFPNLTADPAASTGPVSLKDKF